MNKKRLICLALPLVAISLASCADTDELYPYNLYVGGEGSFERNRYDIWDSELLADDLETASSKEVASDKRFAAGGDDPFYKHSGYGMDDFKRLSTEKGRSKTDYYNGDTELEWLYGGDFGTDIVDNGIGVWADQSAVIPYVYTQNKKMSLINSSFGNGILSKLYNGQIRCNGWSDFAYIQLDQKGYGTMFPLTLTKADYFAFVARGGSNGGDNARDTVFDITVSFYKYEAKALKEYDFTLSGLTLRTNYGAEYTALYGFYFEDVGFDPSGVVGMSMTYSLPSPLTNESSNMDDGVTTNFYTCLILYEVLFPDSTWAK